MTWWRLQDTLGKQKFNKNVLKQTLKETLVLSY